MAGNIGFRKGRGLPSVFWHPEKVIKTLVHGDGYVSAGNDESLKWLDAELSKAYELQSQKIGVGKGSQTEGKVLNRIVRCTSDGWEVEANPRHAELVVERIGLDNEQGVTTPGISGSEEKDVKEDCDLTGDDVTTSAGIYCVLQLFGRRSTRLRISYTIIVQRHEQNNHGIVAGITDY